MSALSKIVRKGAYHSLHPFLRIVRRLFAWNKESARVVLAYKNELLLVRNIGVQRWSFPGGTLDKGEAPEQCALRELREELLIDNAPITYKLGTYSSHTERGHGLVHVFVAAAQSLLYKRQWEIDDARWFALNDLPENLSPATARRIGEYKNGLRDLSTFW